MKIPAKYLLFSPFIRPFLWLMKAGRKEPESLRSLQVSLESRFQATAKKVSKKRILSIALWLFKKIQLTGWSNRLFHFLRSTSRTLEKSYLKTENARVFYRFLVVAYRRQHPYAGIKPDPEKFDDPRLLEIVSSFIRNVPFIAIFHSGFPISYEVCYAVSDFMNSYKQYKSSTRFEHRALHLLEAYERFAEGDTVELSISLTYAWLMERGILALEKRSDKNVRRC